MSQKHLYDFLQVVREAANEAGALLMHSLGKAAMREKKPNDWVTEADVASQEIIFAAIRNRFPDHHLLGEESGADTQEWRDGYCWIVDPLDGTKNFIHGLPSFSISIGLFHNGQPLIGLVFDPMLRETFWSIRGEGAWRNEELIKPSECRTLGKALLVHSFPSSVVEDTPELIRFNNVVKNASTRRLGSAALNLCYVAAGRLDGYWASTLSLWDIAAGILIAAEAGVSISNLDGSPFDVSQLSFCATSTAELGRELLPLLQV